MSTLPFDETAVTPEVNLTTVNVAVPDTAIATYTDAAKALVTDDEFFEIEQTANGIGVPTDQRSADELGSLAVRVGSATKRLRGFWQTPKSAFWTMHGMISNAEKETLKPWVDLDVKIKANALAYRKEQQRLADEAAAERQAKLDAEQQRLREEAKAKMRVGEVDEAREVAARAQALASAPVVQAAPVTVAGMAFGKKWRTSVDDPKLALKAILDGLIPMEAIEWNFTYLNREASAHKGNVSWPGISVTPDDTSRRSSR